MSSSLPSYNIIACVNEEGIIGCNNDLFAKSSEDMKRFKKMTTGSGKNIVIMGRKTWESLPGALPSRQNWVLSRTANQKDGMSVFRSMEEVQQALVPPQTLFIIGGGEIYSMALPLCHELFISEVRRKVPDGDAFFPNYKDQFRPVEVLDDNPDFLLRRWVRA